MCTYETASEQVQGSAKGPGGEWFHVSRATVYFDHPVHAMVAHSLNIDLADPAKGPDVRIGIELTAASARALVEAIDAVLRSVPDALVS